MVLDLRGKACPIPVIETKKLIEAGNQTVPMLEVLVDNEIACQNMKKMTDGKGLASHYQKEADECYRIFITLGEQMVEKETVLAPTMLKSEAKKACGTVVSIGADTMGTGNDDLGKILIKGFLYSLTELAELPTHVVFFNSGVHLVCEGANTIEDIKKLVELGCQVFVCGTCIDFYGLKEQLKVGEITNMYGIVSILSQSQKIITI